MGFRIFLTSKNLSFYFRQKRVVFTERAALSYGYCGIFNTLFVFTLIGIYCLKGLYFLWKGIWEN